MPHQLRLYAILILLALDLAAMAAVHYGVGPPVAEEARELVLTVLATLLALLAPALGDAVLVERRRRDPSISALPDDVLAPDRKLEHRRRPKHIEAPLPWPDPPPASEPPRVKRTGGIDGGALGLVLVAVAVSLLHTGCGGPPEALRRGTTAAAIALAEADRPLAEGYARAHTRALERADTWGEYDTAMAPWVTVEQAARTSAAGLLALDASLDAWDSARREHVFSTAACVAVALERLLRGAVAVGLELPEGIRQAVGFLRLAEGACTERGEW